MSITIIVGKPGAGKTVFATNILVNKMFDSFDDLCALKYEVRRLKSGGFNYIQEQPLQRHLCYSDFAVHVNKRFQSYYINGFNIALPNPYFETTFIPPYSTIFLDEAQRYYDSRNSKSLRSEVYNFYQLHRQNHYNIYLICQRLANIDLNIRCLADKIIVIDDLKFKYDNYGRIKEFKWLTREFESADTAEEYCLQKDKSEFAKLGKKVIVTSDLPLFNYYNSFANKPAFFNGNDIKKFDYSLEPSYDYSVESFNEYNENHLYSAPAGYWKSADYDKQVAKKNNEKISSALCAK